MVSVEGVEGLVMQELHANVDASLMRVRRCEQPAAVAGMEVNSEDGRDFCQRQMQAG